MDIRGQTRRLVFVGAALGGLTGVGAMLAVVALPEGDAGGNARPNEPPSARTATPTAPTHDHGAATSAASGTDNTVFPGPVLEGWPLGRVGMKDPEIDRDKFPLTAVAYYYRTGIFRSVKPKRRRTGFAMRGARVPTAGTVRGSGCKGGRWYRVIGGGYVCSKRGFQVGKQPKAPDLHFALPDGRRPWPYKYVEVTNQNAARLYRLPTADEVVQLDQAAAVAEKGGEATWPEVVERQMKGVFFLAIAGREESLGRAYLKTVHGRYVREQDVKWLPETSMRGEQLGTRFRLPLAFVYGKDRSAFRRRGKRLEPLGIAAKHARFRVARSFAHGAKRYVADTKGRAVALDAVRVARKLPRPSRVPSGAKWLHVDLSEQTLVAYRGNKPVFATILSSGKSGYVPPKGVYRVVQKHLTTTMNGSDPIDGWYEVEEVPWTLYYWGSYAIHGAYWHNDFGNARSHGCTNLAPADARWLYHWTTPKMPRGWHAVVRNGTWVTFTS